MYEYETDYADYEKSSFNIELCECVTATRNRFTLVEKFAVVVRRKV